MGFTTTAAVFLALLFTSLLLIGNAVKVELQGNLSNVFRTVGDIIGKFFFKQNVTRVEFKLKMEGGEAEVQVNEACNVELEFTNNLTLHLRDSDVIASGKVKISGFRGRARLLANGSTGLSGSFDEITVENVRIKGKRNVVEASEIERTRFLNVKNSLITAHNVSGVITSEGSEINIDGESVTIRNFAGAIEASSSGIVIEGACEKLMIGNRLKLE